MSIGTGLVSTPQGDHALLEAVQWVDGVMLGPIATSVAIIAVALLGFAMLMGRIEIRRALSVLLGCFLLFGARGVAEGLLSVAADERSQPVISGAPPQTYPHVPIVHGNNINAFDPYAGTAVIGQSSTD